jgi:hypothetical protein
MNNLIKTVGIILIVIFNLNINATNYIIKIQEDKSSIKISCAEGEHFSNSKCNILIDKINTCPDGYENYSETECKSSSVVTRTRLCSSGYSYNAGAEKCQRTLSHGSASPSCGGGQPGCGYSVKAGEAYDCVYTCDDGRTIQGWYYETCSTGYASNGWCYSTSYVDYTLGTCGTGFISVGDDCAEIKNKLINVCPEGLTDYNDSQCY